MKIHLAEIHGEKCVRLTMTPAFIDIPYLEELRSAFDEAAHIREASTLVLDVGQQSGASLHFPGPEVEQDRFFARWEEFILGLFKLRTRIISIYRGHTGGAGIHLGLLSDLRIAHTGADFDFSCVHRGVLPGTILHWLPKGVGAGVARRLVLLGERISSNEALRLGLIDVVADDPNEAFETVLDKLTGVSPEAVYFLRRSIEDAYRQERAQSVEQLKAVRYRFTREQSRPRGGAPQATVETASRNKS